MTDFLPERSAGGFSRFDGTVEFYSRVNALLSGESVVLDYGAGRGAAANDPVAYRRRLAVLKGRVSSVVGVDIDPVVLENPLLDEAHVLRDTDVPLDDGSVDVVLADYVLEHLPDPAGFAASVDRVLAPGGWLCARTPNRWGYIGVGARAVPNRVHTALAGRLQRRRRDEDVFPTRYLLNTREALRTHFPVATFEHFTYPYDPEPAYFGRSDGVNALADIALRRLPSRFAAILMVFIRKRPGA